MADIQRQDVAFNAPLRWLQLGWSDFSRLPMIRLFYGGSLALTAWRARSGTMALLGGLLLILEMLWNRAALNVFALGFNGMPIGPWWNDARAYRAGQPGASR